jgi:hypothetical protein
VSARFHARKILRSIPRPIWLRDDWERTIAVPRKNRKKN